MNVIKLVMILIMSTLVACGDCKKNILTSDQLSWGIQFTRGSVNYFADSLGHTDTLMVNEIRHFFTPCNKVELSDYQYEIYDVSFLLKSKSPYNSHSTTIILSNSYTATSNPEIYFDNLGPLVVKDASGKSTQIDTIVAGRKLTAVYVYKSDKNIGSDGLARYFSNFFWSKKNGLVCYQTTKGDTFFKM